MITQAQCIGPIPDESYAENILSALARNLPSVAIAPPKPGRLAIVAAGPSAKDHLQELREWDGEIWTINGAMGWLHDEGVKFNAWMALDPEPVMSQLVVCDPPGVTYYLASHCDPWLFDTLHGRNVVLYHSHSGDMPFPKGEPLIKGGTTCLTRAPFLARCLGWRDITLFGGDSSYTDAIYAYRPDRYSLRSQPNAIMVRVGDQHFATTPQLMHQASEIVAMLELFSERGDNTLTLRSGGLAQALSQAPVRQLGEFMTGEERERYGIAV